MYAESNLQTKRQAKAYLQISAASLEKAMRNPDDPLPYIKICNLVRFEPADLVEWAKRRRVRRLTEATQ